MRKVGPIENTNFEVGRSHTSIITCQNLWRTNWKAYNVDLVLTLERMSFDIKDSKDVEITYSDLSEFKQECSLVE